MGSDNPYQEILVCRICRIDQAGSNLSGTTEDVNAASPVRASKTDRLENGGLRNGRTPHDLDKIDRSEDRPERQVKKVDRERYEKPASALKTYKDYRTNEEGEESLSSRKGRRSDVLPPSRSGGRRNDAVDDRMAKPARVLEPEWMSGALDGEADHDDPTGKTVDDFERWKQSMKKNDGSGDIGLPPLVDMGTEITLETGLLDEGITKEVRPPPGLSASRASVQDHNNESATTESFSRPPPIGELDSPDDRTFSLHPPGFPSTKALPTTSQNVHTAVKGSGSSKFSKFFNQTQTATQDHPQTNGPKPAEVAVPRTNNGSDIFANLSGAKSGGNKDDAEGFERILAMLSSQSAPTRAESQIQNSSQKRTGMQYQEPYLQQHRSFNDHHAPPLPPQNTTQSYVGHLDALHSQQTDPRSSSSAHLSRAPGLPAQQRGPPLNNASFGQTYEHQPYSPERQAVPAMRDMTSGPGSIMSHHTQNQDFFSSLLKQSQGAHSGPPYSGQPTHGRLDGGSRSPPHSRQPRDSQGHPQAYRGPTNLEEQQHLHFLRQQQAAQLQHPSNQSHRARDPAELDFVNQMMAEQRLNSDSRDFAQYGSHAHIPQGAQYGAQRRLPLQQGFVTGAGSQPGPGWNGQFEVDPRIPNASQYRP